MGASGFVELDDARAAARDGGHPWWTLSQLSDESALEIDIRPAPSARGQQSNVTEIFAMLRAHVAHRRARGRRHARHRHRSPRRRTTARIRHGSSLFGARRGSEGRDRQRAQGAAARRRRDPRRQPGGDHRDGSDRQPGRGHRGQATGRQAAQRGRSAGADRGRPGGARPARHRPVRRDDRASRRRCAPRVPGARVRVRQTRWRENTRPAVRADGLAGSAVTLRRR